MSLDATTRLERMLTIVPWVADQPAGVSIAEICQRFSINETELLECLDRVFVTGVYPYTPDCLVDVFIDDDHVMIRMSDWFRRPVQLTSDQRLALLMARRTFASLPTSTQNAPLKRALDKIASALEVDEDPVAIDVANVSSGILEQLRQATDEHRRVRITYYTYGRDDFADREIEPWRVVLENGYWYVQARCRRAQGERIFRVDRIQSIELTDEEFVPPARLPEFSVFPVEKISSTIRLKLSPAAHWVVSQYPVTEVEKLSRTEWIVELPVATIGWLERLLLRLGPDAQILDAPDELSAVGAEAARRLLSKYSH